MPGKGTVFCGPGEGNQNLLQGREQRGEQKLLIRNKKFIKSQNLDQKHDIKE